ncbi:MAG: response regulator [Bacteroidetes bacterium HGW-Bacteroidetes-4]|jgi:CheY-like chemotaxis protein|nr:MAG: response regulator [Bacteroidetes bacterium HGW-Bacteroidetes-4]
MTQNWSNKTILVAEDEPANFLFIEKILNSTEVKILRAENGSEAVSLVTSHPEIDLVLMDIYMPNLDGFEAAKQIKILRPGLPVVAQTFYQQEITEKEFGNSGFDAIIRKPVNINKLLAMLERFLVKG